MTTTSVRPAAAPAPPTHRRRHPLVDRVAGGAVTGPVPAWHRPALLGVLLLATVLYGWGIGHAAIHPYYSAAVRSMAVSWRSFVYGGLDPSGSITVDKIPGGLWPQALSVRVFGPHTWAVALPQVVEGVATVWLLYRIVTAWAGPRAGLLAALLLTVTPATTVLDRASISDTLLILLLVVAAGAAMKAVRSGRLFPLLRCGVWVGLAFQAKMLQAWLVLPVFAVVYLWAAPGGRGRRLCHTFVAGVTALVVSCAWVLLVWLTPAGNRPYLDGTRNDNPFSLVFGYNGLSRLGGRPDALGAVPGTDMSRASGDTGWTMLVNHTVGPQIAWFLPLAVIALVAGVRWLRGRPRTDASRAGYVLWGGWLLVHVVVFSNSSGNHEYYTAVLAPALAALGGAGIVAFAAHVRGGGPRAAALPWALGLTAVWAVVLDAPHQGFAPWVLPDVVMLGLCGVLGLRVIGPASSARAVGGALAAGIAAVVLAPAVWSAATLDPLYAGSPTAPVAGPVGAAYQNLSDHEGVTPHFALGDPTRRDRAILGYLTRHHAGERYLVAVQAALTAEPLLRAAPDPMLVMGGFTGLTPYPDANGLSRLVATGQVRYAMLTTLRPDTPATRWARSHCRPVPPRDYGLRPGGHYRLYDCRPAR
ncbi:glycosyltransferase family 39 protein [Streptantibioticus parmotrematis]|uniref:ArnT family glycosyltransferase n=1 Tax=Streptantibioticus parmotrematis TaxID=2873249 RepID=UPI0033F1CB67